MPHAVHVRDPWFGAYAQVFMHTEGVPDFFIGPLYERILPYEKIQGSKVVVKHHGVNEKYVHHTWTDGFLDGDVSLDTGVICFSVHGGTKELPARVLSYPWGDLVWETTLAVSHVETSPDVATFDVCVTHRYTEYGVVKVNVQTLARFRFKRSVDGRTGAASLTNPTRLTWSGDYLQIPQIAIVNCPYDGGSSGFVGPNLNLPEIWVEESLRIARGNLRLGEHSGLRDQAIYKAIEDLSLVDVNWLSDLNDAVSPLSAASQIGRHFSALPHGLQVLRELADLHLLWKYVIQTNVCTVGELEKLRHFLEHGAGELVNRFTTCEMIGHGTAREIIETVYGIATVTYTAKVCVEAGWGPFSSLAQLQTLGLLPGVDDLWDNVPYSFVVDWCIPIQSSITRIQDLTQIIALPITCLVLGQKIEIGTTNVFQSGDHKFTLGLQSTTYDRTVRTSLPSDMSLLGGLRCRDPRKHLLTGTALVIQRLL